MKTITVNLKQCIRFACGADKRLYPHSRLADKQINQHDHHADKRRFWYDRRAGSQCHFLRINIKNPTFI